MGTPDFAVPALQKLIETQHVVGVVTQPDRPAGRGKRMRRSPVGQLADSAEIPLFQPNSLRKYEAAQPIRDWQPDAIVVAAFGQILRPHLLDLPELGCINLHASLLPRWRGASPIQHAILAGDKESGVCLMRMDVGLDTGPVYACQSLPITADETAQSLHDKLAAVGSLLIERDFPALLAGELSATAQNDALATYAPLIAKKDGAIDWTNSAETIDRHIRAFSPWPSAFTSYAGKQLKILSAHPATADSAVAEQPGTIIINNDNIEVVTGKGQLILETIQLQGKKPLPSADFTRGHADFIGTVLGH